MATALALRCRRARPGLFTVGEYLPLEAVGPRHEHLFAFARRHEGRTAVVIVPRLTTKLPLTPDALASLRAMADGDGRYVLNLV